MTAGVQRLYLDAFGRLPSDAKMEFALEFLKQQKSLDDARVWSELCHVLVNVKEFIFLR